MKRLRGLFLTGMLLCTLPASALTLEELDPAQDWWITTLTLKGNEYFAAEELRAILVTPTRPWYTPWRSLPRFDPVTFATDLERLARWYRAQGYYHTQIAYELEANEATHLITARISIHEGEPIQVEQVTLAVSDQPALASALATLRPTLPLREGMVFGEDRYQQSEAQIKEFFLEQGHGRVTVERKAQVILDQRAARVTYTATVGPPAVFGETRVEGTVHSDPALVTRELTYIPGEPFSATAITASQKNLLKLDLFSAVRFLQAESTADAGIIPMRVPMRVRVEEKPFREWTFGIGYATEDEFRGQVRWRHANWLGGGRKLDLQAQVSAITRHLDVSFLQPHVLSRQNRFSLTFRPQQLDEPGYLLNLTRVQPRLERDFTDTLSGFLAYRLEYDQLNNVAPATIRVLRAFARKGTLSGFSVGLLWNTADDPLNPTTGRLVSLAAEQVGDAFGGDFAFYKLQGEVRQYHLLAAQTVFAARLKLGFADPLGGSAEVPLFERFYAGGMNSVRGYGRQRLGPLSAADDPVGGRSLVEGSLELRRQLFAKIGGAVFLDFGQVSLHSFDLPVNTLKYAMGFGVRYTTPVGPLRLDVGFPFDPPRQDQPWQLHFSIGQFF